MPALAKPAMGDFTDLYGWRIIDGVRNFHNGVDIGHLYAEPAASRRVLSAIPGTVQDVGYSAAAGYYITVRVDARWLVRYIHLLGGSERVAPGQKVGYSTHLATMGNSGTKYVHLHFDLFDLSKTTTEKRVDPKPYMALPYGYTGLTSAGGGQTPISPVEEDMPVLIRREGTSAEWSLFDPNLAGPTSLERGYIITTDLETATGWARIWAGGIGNEKSEPRDVYIGMQSSARLVHAARQRSNPPAVSTAAIVKAVVDAVSALPQGSTVDYAAVGQAVDAALADDFAAVKANIDDQPVEFTISPKES